MGKENILISICARANSKGLPGKHLKDLHGKPLIAWTIKQAGEWGKGFAVLSSDYIYSLRPTGHKYNHEMEYIQRPEELAHTHTPKMDAISHALRCMELSHDKTYDIIIDLDATNPLRRIEDIENAYQTFIKGGYDSLSSVVKARKNPYWGLVEYRLFNDTRIMSCKTAFRTVTCRQKAPIVYEQNANIYVYKREYLLDESNKSDIGDNTGIYIMPDWTFCDVNTELDFKIVELLMKEYLL